MEETPKMHLRSKIYTGIVFAFLFAPIVVMLIYSFNASKSLSVYSGFSLRWYQELLSDRNTLLAVKNTFTHLFIYLFIYLFIRLLF